MTFLKMRDDASQKLPSMIRACRCLCFLIHACRFSPLLCLRVVVREVSDFHLLITSSLLLLLLLSPSSSPPPSRVIDHHLRPICIPPLKPLSQLIPTLSLPKELFEEVSSKLRGHTCEHT